MNCRVPLFRFRPAACEMTQKSAWMCVTEPFRWFGSLFPLVHPIPAAATLAGFLLKSGSHARAGSGGRLRRVTPSEVDCRAKQDAATALSARWGECKQMRKRWSGYSKNSGCPGNGLRHNRQQLACSSLVFMIGPAELGVMAEETPWKRLAAHPQDGVTPL